MYCSRCGTELLEPAAAFCHKCGTPTAPAVTPTTPAQGRHLTAPFTWVFWLLLVCAALAWVGPVVILAAGHELKGQITLGAAAWTGGLFAYIWKKRHNRPWLGFGFGFGIGIGIGIGALITIAAISLVMFCISYVRVQSLLKQSGNVPEVQK